MGFTITLFVFACCLGEAVSDCIDDVASQPYSGHVSETNFGYTCQAWAYFPSKFTDKQFPIDGSVAEASNYCRNFDGSEIPWCFTTDPDVVYGFCDLRICFGHTRDCSGVLRTRTGYISPPDSDGDGFYDNYVNCMWKVEAADGLIIRYEIHNLSIEATTDCLDDGLAVFETDASLHEDILQLCGEFINFVIKGETKFNMLHVEFFSDGLRSNLGFNLTYLQQKATNKSCNATLTDSSGWIASPDFDNDGDYDYYLNCYWTVQVKENSVVVFQVLFVRIQYADGCKQDFLEISDDVGRLSLLCGFSDERRPSMETRTRRMIVHFRTNNFLSYDGFNLTYYEQLAKPIHLCGGTLTSKTGFITSPDIDNNGKYDKNVDCLWTIQAPKGHFIRYTFQYFDVEESDDCVKDTLWTFEKGSDNMISYCGTSNDEFGGETSSDVLHIRFRTDDSLEYTGFNLTFSQIQVSEEQCGGIITDFSGSLSSPDEDNDGYYDFNQDCHWSLEVTVNMSIQFQFLYILLEPGDPCIIADYVEVRDDPVITTYCGYHGTQEPVISATNILDVFFVSNDRLNAHGFNMTFREVEKPPGCEEVLEREEGWISSPDYDKDGLYDHNLRCQWTIKAPANRSIELQVLRVRTEYTLGCTADALAIKEHAKERYTYKLLFEVFCGQYAKQAPMRSVTSVVNLIFFSDFIENDSGFLVFYKTVPGTFSQKQLDLIRVPGSLAAPDRDGDLLYDLNMFNVWTLMAEDISSILIQLLYLDTEKSPSCANDHLQIYSDGLYRKLCGIVTKIIYITDGKWAVIFFTSDYTVNGLGFLMKFSKIAVKSEECGGLLTGPTQHIAPLDRDKDGFYDTNVDCQWSIRLEDNKVIVFEVLEMDIQDSAKCSADSLTLYEEHMAIGKYCGSSSPEPITTEANALYLLFTSDSAISGKGFLAVYFQTEDASVCLPEYECQLSDLSFPRLSLCDSYRDCPNGDDERFCSFRCPSGCSCNGLSIDCSGKMVCESDIKTTFVPNNTIVIPRATKRLDVSTRGDIYNSLKLENQELGFLIYLNLSHCAISDLPDKIFMSMQNLKTLDLSYNALRRFKSGTFASQANLETFYFVGNSERLIIDPQSFDGLSSLTYLTLSDLNIERISENAFATLRLKELNIYHCHIDIVESNSLGNLYTEGIFLNGSTINTLSEPMFDGVQGVKTFVSDYFKFCCVRPSSVTEENCYPHVDEFSSCDDLIRNEILRPLIWIMGLFTLISNIISLVCRFIYQREQLKHSYGIFVSHLAVSDFLMGIYLIIVAGADITLRGEYIFHKDWWQQSVWCKLAGTLSTVSSEASVLFICLITLDRLLAVKYPFGQRRLSLNVGHVLAIVVWIIAIVIAVLPLTLTPFFHDDFYSQSGVCLALPLTRARVSGWLYSVAVFVVFNTVSCLLLAVGQWIIYSEIKASAKASGTSRRQTKRSKDTRMAWNLLLVVSTDFLCWLPIGILGVLASVGQEIHGDVFSWIAVVVLPINSAVNPILYTLSAVIQKRRAVQKTTEQPTKESVITADLVHGIEVWKLPGFWQFPGQENGYKSLSGELKQDWLDAKIRLQVAKDTVRRMLEMHNRRLAFKSLTIDDIFIQPADKLPIRTALICRPKLVLKEEDYGENISSLKPILSGLIKETS